MITEDEKIDNTIISFSKSEEKESLSKQEILNFDGLSKSADEQAVNVQEFVDSVAGVQPDEDESLEEVFDHGNENTMVDVLKETDINNLPNMEIRDKAGSIEEALLEFQNAYKDTLVLRADFSTIPDYVREKGSEEAAYHEAKKAFGEFRPNDYEAMESNNNNGKGVDVVLPNGKVDHISNQAQLFEKIVAFNADQGSFYNEERIHAISPSDYNRLQSINSTLETARKNVLNLFDSKKEGYQVINIAENEAKSKQENSVASPSDKMTNEKTNQDKESNKDAMDEQNDRNLQQEPLPSQQGPQPIQTNVAGGLAHALGSVAKGLFGFAATGIAAAQETKKALSGGQESATKIENKAELGAHFHFNPASRAVDDTFNDDKVNNWKQNRIDSEFESLQTDINAHIKAVERVTKTEWATKAKVIENSGDPEMKLKAPMILGALKKKSDFADANKDMAYFQNHIEMRAGMLAEHMNETNIGTEKLENALEKWHDKAKKKLVDLPNSVEKDGILDRIKNSAQKILAIINSVFSKSTSMKQ